MRHVRYVGATPITLSNPGREVFTGDTFSVPEELIDGYVTRDDVELIDVETDSGDDVTPVEAAVSDVAAVSKPKTKTTVTIKTAD